MANKLFFCGRLDCKHNCDGTCILKGIALNEAGICVGYKPDPDTDTYPIYTKAVGNNG